MMRRSPLISILLLSGCMAPQSMSGRGLLILKPQIMPGIYATKTTISPYTQSSIDHLILKLFTFDGTEHDQGISKTIPNAQLGNTIAFTNLKANTTYRIKAYAYFTSDQSQLISTTDANSYTDVTLITDDHPAIAALKVKLIDQPFNGQATASGIVVNNGGYNYSASESCTVPHIVSTFAGGAGGITAGNADGTGTAAKFNNTWGGIAVDISGNVYVADWNNHLIRKITSNGVVSTLAGQAGAPGHTDGMGTAAKFNCPSAVSVDPAGNVYVAEYTGQVVRKITSAGVVSTLAGQYGINGHADGTGTVAQFYNPFGITVDGSGNLYVADQNNELIRKITSDGVVSTLAGQYGTSGNADGTGTAAQFYNPNGIVADGAGNIYVSDYNGQLIRKITSSGIVSTIAGKYNTAAAVDGLGTAARFSFPIALALDGFGNLYVADRHNNSIREITSGGLVSTLAGGSASGYADGISTAAKFNCPSGVAVDGSGNVYVMDNSNNLVRVIK